jgi:hypothetical protein
MNPTVSGITIDESHDTRTTTKSRKIVIHIPVMYPTLVPPRRACLTGGESTGLGQNR